MRRLLLAAGCAALTACAAWGGVTDGTSLARGWVNGGVLENGLRLPKKGDGYLVPSLWVNRGSSYGTDELVGAIVRSARRVHEEYPDATLYVGDLSPLRGGRTEWHRSHQNGRDADLIFYARTADGKPAPVPSNMIRYDADGKARNGSKLVFDEEREWALVRALLEDPGVDVQYLFIATPLRQRLLDWASAHHEPPDLIERAAIVLTQPAEAEAHDDHLHLRIYCPKNDRQLGCKERGPMRWFKKTYKYLDERGAGQAPPPALASALERPFCMLFGSSYTALL